MRLLDQGPSTKAPAQVVAGVALVGTRDGMIIEAHPGETVACPPDEEHWHGATSDQFMEHLALWESDATGATETTWLEPVTDAQYNGARANPPLGPRRVGRRGPGS